MLSIISRPIKTVKKKKKKLLAVFTVRYGEGVEVKDDNQLDFIFRM